MTFKKVFNFINFKSFRNDRLNDFRDRHVDDGGQDRLCGDASGRRSLRIRRSQVFPGNDEDSDLIGDSEIRNALDQSLERIFQTGNEHRNSDQIVSDPKNKIKINFFYKSYF